MGGAYIGDTIEEFEKFTKGQYERIIAFEPDRDNLSILRRNTKNKKIEIIEKGLWNKKTILNFMDNKLDSSRISENGGTKIEVDSIDNICQDIHVSLIKMDIEGAELKGLYGAQKVIKRDKPVLAICIYHSYSDRHMIPQYIKELEPSYNIFIRSHNDTGTETVMYAIP